MAIFDRRVKVGNTESFKLDVSDWAADEVVTAFTATSDTLTTVADSVIDGTYLIVRLTGVSEGDSAILFEFETATRTNCTTEYVVVTSACSL